MRVILLTQMAVAVLGFLLISVANAQHNALSFLYGAGISIMNIGLMTWLWDKILNKKLIALAVLIIVFKYAIFGIIIYKILTSPGVDALWFSVGLSTLIVSVVSLVFFGGIPTDGQKKKRTAKRSS